MHNVFISYSTKDQFQADTVRDVLEKNGISCWMAPRDIPTGSSYTKEIPVAIRSCQIFVLILSQNSQSSHWVLKELDSAVNCSKVILPFMVEEFQLNDEFNFLLTGAQRYAAYLKKSEAMEALISRIQALNSSFANSEKKAEAPVVSPIPEEASPAVKHTTVFFKGTQCPSCGSHDMIELKKNKRITIAEKLTLLLCPVIAVVCAFTLFLIAAIVLAVINEFAPAFSHLKVFDTVFTIASIGGLVGGGFLGHRLTKEWIRRRRIRQHIHPYPFRCSACCKVFLVNEK